MLKEAYISVAQAVLGAPMKRYYASPTRPLTGRWQRWFASLGAVYHLDRMIALDVPWWNVAATERVIAFLAERPKARIFEYGSGASTVWLARRGLEVTSVEHDEQWANALAPRLSSYQNVTLLRAQLRTGRIASEQPYVKTIRGTGLYDMIVVDGRERAACLSAAVASLKSDGIILFDDSGRERYREAILNCSLSEKRYFGLSYCVPYPDYTSILAPNA
jgi:Dimethyladenosine transferase (rRNA methylation)